MKTLVLGGYGVFGSRICELLCKDGHVVIIAGRTLQKAQALADKLGATAVLIDRNADLSQIMYMQVTTVIDASGPFNAYGNDPYHLVQYCLEHGVNYIDLSDSADFTTGVLQFDGLAKANNCFALSGASSVPAVSAAVVTELSKGFGSLASIEIAILPGNKAPRGYSVVASILSQVGLPITLWRGGKWRAQPCWDEPRTYVFKNGKSRVAKTIGAPDLSLFPEHFKAHSVVFRAGLELRALNFAVQLIATMNKLLKRPPPEWLLRLSHKITLPTKTFGTETGGMIVDVIGHKQGKTYRNRWQLWAEDGDGPYIPTLTVRAILAKPSTIPYGARACLNDISLDDLRTTFQDLSVSETTEHSIYTPLFQQALGTRFKSLPESVQELHSQIEYASFSGKAGVTRGQNGLSKLIAAIFGFPKAGTEISVHVEMTCQEDCEVWRRIFDGKAFQSVLTPSRSNHFKERFGLFTFEMHLPVKSGALHMPVQKGWFLGIPMPKALLPKSETREYEADDTFHFDVSLSAPICGLLVRYQGWLIRDKEAISSCPKNHALLESRHDMLPYVPK